MSRKPEQKLWDLLRPAIKGAKCRPIRVENLVEEGFPDILVQHSITGWTFIETKARPSPPARITSRALGATYGLSLQQRNWWKDYTDWGGRRGLIVSRIGKLVFAHDAIEADDINAMTYEEFCDRSIADSAAKVAALCVKSEAYWR